MKKIAVPEGMCGAAENMWMVCGDYPVDPERFRKHVLPVVRAALLWLSENPTTPNEDQLRDMQAEYKRQGYDGTGHGFVAEEWQRRMFLAPEQDDSRFAKVKTVLNRYFYMGNPQFDKFADEVVPHILSAIDTPDCSGCGESNGHKWDCPKLREKAEPPQENDPDPVIELMERRMAEYSNWVHRNLQNLFDKKPLEPRLDWEKTGKKVFTYGDRKAGSR